MQATEELRAALAHLEKAKAEMGQQHWPPPRRKDQAPKSLGLYWASRGTVTAINFIKYALDHLEQEKEE